jgi:hypothetical protein
MLEWAFNPLHVSKPFTSSPAARSAAAWFLDSGIQQPDGGVARYYRSDSSSYAPASTEITGYAASVLTWLADVGADGDCLEGAERAATYLIRIWDERSSIFPFEPVLNGDPAFAYFFDCGIIARGLLAVWRATPKAEYLEKAKECALSMAFDFMADEGMHPVLQLPEKEPVSYEPRWSRRPGCYQLKSAMAWRDVAEATGRAELISAYERMVAFSLATHEQFLPGDPADDKVMDRLHAYAYFLEGLLPVGQRPESREAIAGGIERISEYLRRIAPVFARSDVYAQLLRLRLYADRIGIVPLDESAAAEEADAIAEFQMREGQSDVAGGFCFGRKNGTLLPFINPVSTAFCIQALVMWEQFQRGEFEAAVTSLV